MADKILYATKVQGQVNPADENKKYTFVDANEVKAVVNAHADNIEELLIDFLPGTIPSIDNKLYVITLNIPYAGFITTTSTKSVSGTATGTFGISGTVLGGTANAISDTENIQAHASDNVFAAGDDIELTITSNAATVDCNFTVTYTRTLA